MNGYSRNQQLRYDGLKSSRNEVGLGYERVYTLMDENYIPSTP